MFVVVGVTGGIAAYKTVHVVRRLIARGHDVHVVPTEDALRFVGLATWEAISRNPVTTSVHDDVATVRHVSLGQRADLVIVAPATANAMAKMATGIADDLLGTTLLATSAPVAIAPAMHTEMWRHPATRANAALLRERGVHLIGPDEGPLTGGDSGPGRMSEPDDIVERALALAGEGDDLSGLRVVVTAGGTREPLDPVRFLGNRSSGRQGVALAAAAEARGADVTLIAANVADDVRAGAPRAEVVPVGTARELQEAAEEAAARADVIVMAAAVADYRPAEVAEGKLTKDELGDRLVVELVENPDIVAGLAARRRPGQTIVAFAAETAGDEMIDRARRKRERKGVDMLVVNEVGWEKGFDAVENSVAIVDRMGGVTSRAEGTKRAVADVVWDAVLASRGA